MDCPDTLSFSSPRRCPQFKKGFHNKSLKAEAAAAAAAGGAVGGPGGDDDAEGGEFRVVSGGKASLLNRNEMRAGVNALRVAAGEIVVDAPASGERETWEEDDEFPGIDVDGDVFSTDRFEVDSQASTDAAAARSGKTGWGDVAASPSPLPALFRLEEDVQRASLARDFDAVVVDEAGQCTEPETIVPVNWRSTRKLVLIGDDKQLGPTVVDPHVRQLGYGTSAFERLALSTPPFLLAQQHRMHPSLSAFSNRQFYEGLVKDGVDVSDRPMDHINVRHISRAASAAPSDSPSPPPMPPLTTLPPHSPPSRPTHHPPAPQFAWPGREPLFMHDVRGPELYGASGISYSNEPEAKVAIETIHKLLVAGARPERLGVITFYEAQRSLLDALVTSHPQISSAAARAIEIANVDAFQGREKDYVVISCVRSNAKRQAGFISEESRFNVAITRAKYGMIVIGDPTVRTREGRGMGTGAWVHCCER